MSRQWDADIDITETMVQEVLSSQFPELLPARVELLDAGWDNFVFIVNQIYVFRFPRRKIAVELIEMENQLLPWLAPQLPVMIPNPRFMGGQSSLYPFSGYLKIDGIVPYRVHLTDEQRTKAAHPLARFLRALHTLDTEQAIAHRIAASDTIFRLDTKKRIPQLVERINEARKKGLIRETGPMLAFLEDLTDMPLRTAHRRTVVHGDLNFRNFLITKNGDLTGVIDWGDAHIGHPAVDLALTYTYLPRSSHHEFFSVYGSVDSETELLARFRALYMSFLILIYAHEIGDERQLLEAQWSISNLSMR
ncbi:phosphotransferase [Alicyclobacillus curvatus]|jgi:aminoglycoside phosphotransferase (APT) family kinase protein|nr:phosphotransferase [Alicyclobacillus curvatus]